MKVYNSKQKWNHEEFWYKCKELDDWGSCKKDYMWNPSTCDCVCNKACKIDQQLDTKRCSREKRLIGKLLLACEDEILNTTETSFDAKHVTCEKSNCFIQTISMILYAQQQSFLLVVITIIQEIKSFFKSNMWKK